MKDWYTLIHLPSSCVVYKKVTGNDLYGRWSFMFQICVCVYTSLDYTILYIDTGCFITCMYHMYHLKGNWQ